MTNADARYTSQSDRLNDHVFPLCNVEEDGDGVRLTDFLASGFFIGNRGHGLTAAHVLKNATTPAVIMVAAGPVFRAFGITHQEKHSTEDLAVLRVQPLRSGVPWRSMVTRPTVTRSRPSLTSWLGIRSRRSMSLNTTVASCHGQT